MKKQSIYLILFIVEIFSPSFAGAAETTQERVGLIYPLGKVEGTPLFTQKTSYVTDAEGKTTASSSIVDSKGKVVLTELAVFKGSILISQSVEQFQTGHQYTVTPKAEKVYFKTEHKAGSKKVEEDDVDLTNDFITGPTTQPFLAEHWNELLEGKSVYCRFGVLESQETFGFNFKMKRKETVNNKELIVVSMKPSSFFNNFIFSLLEDGIEIYLDPSTKKYVRYKGLTPVQKVDEEGKLHRFSAEIIYE